MRLWFGLMMICLYFSSPVFAEEWEDPAIKGKILQEAMASCLGEIYGAGHTGDKNDRDGYQSSYDMTKIDQCLLQKGVSSVPYSVKEKSPFNVYFVDHTLLNERGDYHPETKSLVSETHLPMEQTLVKQDDPVPVPEDNSITNTSSPHRVYVPLSKNKEDHPTPIFLNR